MEIIGTGITESEKNSRGIRVYVRVKGVINGLVEGTSKARTPPTIFEFAKRITQEGKFLPPEYVLPVEKKRLTFDVNGRLMFDFFCGRKFEGDKKTGENPIKGM